MFIKTTFPTQPGIKPSPLEPIAPLTPVIIHGDDNDNEISGGFDNDSLFGNGGDDMLEGLWGDDVLYGGEGEDGLFGGSGDDKLYGDDDNEHDVLSGGSGNDKLYAGNYDLAVGASGDDLITTKSVQVRLDGGVGDDTLISFGREGTDIRAAGNANSLRGGDGDDTMIMIGGFADASGGEGNDTFFFGAIEDGGTFTATDREGANDYHFWNANHERLAVDIEGFDADDSLHFHNLFDDISTLDSNGDGFITDADDFVFFGNNQSISIIMDNLLVTVENNDWLTSDENWLSADQVEIL